MNQKPQVYEIQIRSREQIGPAEVILSFYQEQIAAAAVPGQFINISCDQFLRRPLGIMDVDRKAGLVKVGIRVQGRGTRWLAERQPGDKLSVLGPLGNGFLFADYTKIITVGGGTGVFPLYFVHRVCQEKGIESLAICGYRSRNESILTDDFSLLGCQVLFASDAGDMDISGHAGKALQYLLQSGENTLRTAVFTCGPKPLMQEVSRLAAEYSLPCQVSLEERMACGIGACLVCTCAIKDSGTGEIRRERCCVEGPVFPAESVVW